MTSVGVMSITRAPRTSSPGPTMRPSTIASFRSGEYKIVPSTASNGSAVSGGDVGRARAAAGAGRGARSTLVAGDSTRAGGSVRVGGGSTRVGGGSARVGGGSTLVGGGAAREGRSVALAAGACARPLESVTPRDGVTERGAAGAPAVCDCGAIGDLFCVIAGAGAGRVGPT